MSFLRAITPNNLQTEKEKFFKDHTYNPQFEYSGEIEQDKLIQYGIPKPQFVQLSQEILDRTFSQYSDKDIEASEGKQLTQREVDDKILAFLQMHNLDKRFSINWSSAYISRTSISSDTIKLRLPVDFRQESLLGMLYHEIGTHALRRINYEEQSWYKKKSKYGFSEYLYTEEGLAALHGLLPHTIKYAYKQAHLYQGVAFAQAHSFAETWGKMAKYQPNTERRWTLVSRLKRGIADTSQPGGYTKDIVYFEGLLQTWQWLNAHNFDLTPLYYGKLAAKDAAEAMSLNPHYKPIVPSFFSVQREDYAEKMAAIGETNLLFTEF